MERDILSKIKINMLSSADSVEGQGVGSAYLEQVKLVSEGLSDKFEVSVNAKVKADITHIHTIEPKNYWKMLRSKGTTVSYVHFLPTTLDGSIKLPKPIFFILKKYVISFYNHADHLVVVNPIFMNDLEKCGIDRNKISYIPNYVSKADFYKKSKDEINVIKDQYGIKHDAFVVLGVGQVQTRKGVLDFIEVAKSLPDVTFVWAGGFSFGKITDGYEELKKIVENPPANVKFTGIIPRTSMNDMFNLADILFMPSFNELFPMAILEAVNLEKPLLLRNLELYEDILFNKYMLGSNVAEFATGIQLLKNDKETYDKHAKYSKEISEYYSKENVCEIWRKFYTTINDEHKKKHS
ncbi:MAG: glycosyltransferase family 4 protein [Erysipelotrichaceae bacterium]